MRTRVNVLLVDDKHDVLQGIAEGVNWSEIGDIKLFFASSGAEALEIIGRQIIQLLITDIEMPGISGLKLVEKLLQEKRDIATVFLTSHDSFRYAQAAIRMGCCDYILQPVDYKKLQESIIRVINNRLTQQIEKDWDNRVKGKEEIERKQKNAWRKILTKNPSCNLETMREILAEVQVFLSDAKLYRLILATLLWHKETLNNWVNHKEDECFIHIKQSFAKDIPVVTGFEVDMTQWCIVLENVEGYDVPTHLQPFTRLETAGGISSFAFYVSDRAKLEALPREYQRLRKLSNDNVGKYEGVYEYRDLTDTHREELVTCDELSMQKWKNWLVDGKEDLIKEEVRRFLFSRNKREKLDRTTLMLVVQLVINVFYSFDLQATEHLIAQRSLAGSFAKATDSPNDLLLFLDEVIQQYREKRSTACTDAGAELLNRIKIYIDSHIESRLDRNEISEKFFISKDYLTHLFSKYENRGFSQYVNDKRLDKAKRLMLETNLPLKVISENVGISDYAYFSKLFKNHIGVSANEYRSSHRKKT